jgi:hypothetical protein
MKPSIRPLLRLVTAAALALPLVAAAAPDARKGAPGQPSTADPAAQARAEAFQAAAKRLEDRWKAEARKAQDPLIRLLYGAPFAAGELEAVAARSTRDPLALMALLSVCTAKPPPADCPRQSPAMTLTRIDGENAAAWIERVNAAVAANNAADLDASLTRAAAAPRYDVGLGPTLKRLADFAQKIEPGMPLPVVVAVGGGALRPQALGPLLEACRPAKAGNKAGALTEARSRQCWSLFELMATKGTDVAGVWTGASMLKRLASSETQSKRAAQLRLRAGQLAAASVVGDWATPDARMDLSPQSAWSLYLTDLIAVGEVAAIERALARSGKKLADIDPNAPPPKLSR